jgi:hypothetical protein
MCAIFSALAFIRATSFALRSWFVMFEGSGTKEISLPSRWWCSSSTSFVVASWVFSAETRWRFEGDRFSWIPQH